MNKFDMWQQPTGGGGSSKPSALSYQTKKRLERQNHVSFR